MIVDYKRLAFIIALAVCAAILSTYGPSGSREVSAALAVIVAGSLRSFLSGDGKAPPPMLPVLLCVAFLGCASKLPTDTGQQLVEHADKLAACRQRGREADAGADASPETVKGAKEREYEACKKETIR